MSDIAQWTDQSSLPSCLHKCSVILRSLNMLEDNVYKMPLVLANNYLFWNKKIKTEEYKIVDIF
jgi:hypothetical protein